MLPIVSLSNDNDNCDTDKLKNEFVGIVKSKGYVRQEIAFRLSSGGFSHDYVDMRKALSAGNDLKLAARYLLTTLEIEGIDFDAVGGMTMGADPIAHAVAILSGKSWFSVRKQEKTHGTKQRIEGASVDANTKVLLVEDTVSTGRSALEALEVLRNEGAQITALCVLLDRGVGMTEKMAEQKIRYLSLLTYKDLEIDHL